MARVTSDRKTAIYRHLVWNRTDQTIAQVNAGNLAYSYQGELYVSKNDPFWNINGSQGSAVNSSYKGEVIPPYAAMKIIAEPVYYKDRICWPVGRPDDLSLDNQIPGVHFFNGPAPILVKGYGEATNDLPAPALLDMTGQSASFPYGNTPTPQTNPAALGGAPLNVQGLLFGFFSGCWALHPAADVLTIASNILSFGANYGSGSAAVNFNAMFIPYTITGQFIDLAKKPTKGQDFYYSTQIAYVGPGSLAIAWAASEG